MRYNHSSENTVKWGDMDMLQIIFALLIFGLPFILIFYGNNNAVKSPILAFIQMSVGASALFVVACTLAADSLGVNREIYFIFGYMGLIIFIIAYIIIQNYWSKPHIYKSSAYKPIVAQKSPVDPLLAARDEEVNELISKATLDFVHINNYLPDIENEEISELTERLIDLASKLLDYIDEDSERILLVREFVNYYQDRTAELLKKYMSLKATGIETEPLRKLECDIISTFQGFVVVYEKQLEKVISADIMDMDAEMKVARQLMKNDGISCDARKVDIVKEKPTNIKVENKVNNTPEKPADNGFGFKYAGVAAVGAVVLGAVGLYNFFRKKE